LDLELLADDLRQQPRRLSHRQQLVRARSRANNKIHAVLMRRLKGKPPFADLFGVRARPVAGWCSGCDRFAVGCEAA
jgi:hypothetical protein